MDIEQLQKRIQWVEEDRRKEKDAIALLENKQPREAKKLASAICGPKASFSEIRSIVEALLFELGMKCEFGELESHPTFIRGRAAEIVLDGKPIGIFGEIHPQVLNNFGIEQPVAAFEIELG